MVVEIFMFKKLSWRYLVLKIFFKISFLKKKICDFYSTRLVDHFDTKQVIICDKISILDFAYVSHLNTRMTVKKVYRERPEASISTPLKMIRFFIFISNCLLHQLCDNVYFVLLFTFRKSITHTTQDRIICTIYK